MSEIRRYLLFSHLRADPNQHILHYKGGRVVRGGAGLAYWFNPLSAAIAQVPVEDIETTVLLRERSADFQEVTVQCVLTYRCSDPSKVAARVNFTISLESGQWTQQPLERLAGLLNTRAQQPVRDYLADVSVTEAIQKGGAVMTERIRTGIQEDQELVETGIQLVSVQVTRVAPSSELEKALEAPTREAIQQKADEATFERRALAVEKERAIKENELATEIELARRQEDLIAQQSKNRLLNVDQEAAAEKAKAEAAAERAAIAARAYARDVLARAEGDAQAKRQVEDVSIDTEGKRLELWKNTPPRVAAGMALQDAARNLQTIQHLNLTPDLLGETLQQFLRDQPTGK
jgi:regulator of protease activity HflC (stomatin/prohibitin superfamily)